jgi:hypothetical protein
MNQTFEMVPIGATSDTKWVVMDNSLYKTNQNEDGVNAHYCVVMPTVTLGRELGERYKVLRGLRGTSQSRNFQSEDDFYMEWSVVKQGSNYVNTVDKTSNVKIKALSPLDQQDVFFSVENIQEGEVVYLSLILTVVSGGESYEAYGNQVIIRGDPENSNFRIYKCENGRLINEVVYDSAIEASIMSALGGEYLHSHWTRTDNGNKKLIKPYLKKMLKDRDRIRKVPGGLEKEVDEEGNEVTSSIYGFQSIQDEYKLYAHGRDVTEEAILTLTKVHPGDALDNSLVKTPRMDLFHIAVDNRTYLQPVGYNGIPLPLLNPSDDAINGVKLYYPGRSSHGSTGQRSNNCGKSNNQTNNNSGFYNNALGPNNPRPSSSNSCYRNQKPNNCCKK